MRGGGKQYGFIRRRKPAAAGVAGGMAEAVAFGPRLKPGVRTSDPGGARAECPTGQWCLDAFNVGRASCVIKPCQDCGGPIEIAPSDPYQWCERCWSKLLDELFPEFAPHYEESE